MESKCIIFVIRVDSFTFHSIQQSFIACMCVIKRSQNNYQSTDYYIKKYNKEFDGEVYTREEKIIQFAHENMTTRKICFKKKMFQIFTEEDLIKRNE